MAERHVDHVDAERILVGDRELQPRDDGARRSAAAVVEAAQPDHVRRGGDAFELSTGELAGSSDETGDVRAVPVAVNGCGRNAALAVGEVVERADASREIGYVRDAGIDDRDADAVAGWIGVRESELVAQLTGLPDSAGAALIEDVFRGERTGSDR